MTPNCPRHSGRECHPGPREGCCCEEIPPGPRGFGVIYRNPGHWDITCAGTRAFRIRGEGREVLVNDHRKHTPRAQDGWLKFPSVMAARCGCACELMEAPEVSEALPETQGQSGSSRTP